MFPMNGISLGGLFLQMGSEKTRCSPSFLISWGEFQPVEIKFLYLVLIDKNLLPPICVVFNHSEVSC